MFTPLCMTQKISAKKWFTLVEMLIVIVIIGILASALIPRLSQARERANDTARKAHIQNIATVLIAYQIDKGSYPATAWTIASIESQLIWAWLSSVPTDPDANRSFVGIGNSASPYACLPSTAGQYMYTPVRKRGIAGAWFALMAGTQTEWWSNFVWQSSYAGSGYAGWCINTAVDFTAIPECQTFTNGTTNLSTCTYNNQADELRYIYKQ